MDHQKTWQAPRCPWTEDDACARASRSLGCTTLGPIPDDNDGDGDGDDDDGDDEDGDDDHGDDDDEHHTIRTKKDLFC